MDVLMDAMRAAPEDDAPRLVWADREGGARGELVVLQCLLAREELPHADRLRMAARVHELLRKHGHDWDPLKALATTSHADAFVRGFVEHAAVEVSVLGGQAAVLFERAPLLRSLRLEGTSASISDCVGPPADATWAAMRVVLAEALSALPPGRITALAAKAEIAVHGDWADPVMTFHYGDDLVKIVADALALRGLRSLEVTESGVTDSAIPHLARLPLLERFVIHPRGGDDGMLRRAQAR